MSSAIDELLGHVQALTSERAELTARIKNIEADVATLRRAAEILDPRLSNGHGLAAGTPKRRARGHVFPNFTQAMLETLRDAPESLTASDVGRLTMERLGMPMDGLTRSEVTSRATGALAKYARRGILVRLDEGGTLRWKVAR